jgi:NTE family protein
MANKYPKIGLALGSGAAKGLAHIGVLKSLEKHSIPIDYIAASSIGAIMGAHYSRFKDIQRLENAVLSFNRKKGMELFDFTVVGGIIKGKKTEGFLSELLENATFQDLTIPLTIIATDFNTAQQVLFTKDNLVKAIRASIAVPAIYQPIYYLDKLLADGGLSNPVPVSVAASMGSDITIAVNLDHIFVEPFDTTLPTLTRMPLQAMDILRHNIALQAMKNADIIITPQNKLRVGFMGWNTLFNNERALQVIQEGETAADKMIPEIKRQIEAYQKRQLPMNRLLSLFKIRRIKSENNPFQG